MRDPEADRRFMAAALALGRRGLGLCAPNPAVGALVVAGETILSRGWTKPGGRPHAETEALREAGPSAKGATLYVTLEPCSHHGVTPPCTDAIIAAQIARVVYAVGDPDPRVAGLGHKQLTDAGIEVTGGVLEDAARRANLGHILRVSKRRPMVTLKLALTADLYAAGSRHDRRLVITGAAANGFVHVQRALHDAIMVGSGTIEADDSLLTVRLPGLEERRPLRVVLATDLALPQETRLSATADIVPTLVIGAEGAKEALADRLRAENIAVAFVPREGASGTGSGSPAYADLSAALELLATRGITRVFCEGGPRLASRLIEQDLADEIMILTSPKALGREGVPGLGSIAAAALADPALYEIRAKRALGIDQLAHYMRRF
jgi:diaminohydroxyphosphoribosylaminopyrimidine deaminase/5-amino-6-(5-phosphoribosylamino)uracil reductase